MLYKKLSSLFLIFLILNLNMVVPAVSYATAEETCSCHLNNADHQCHCEDGCSSCAMHKNSEQSSVNSEQLKLKTEIKGMTCTTSPQNDGSVLPVSAIPFMVPVFGNAIPTVRVSNLPNIIISPLYGVTVTPSEKPPTV